MGKRKCVPICLWACSTLTCLLYVLEPRVLPSLLQALSDSLCRYSQSLIVGSACDPSLCPPIQDVLEGGNLRNALQELQQIIITPIKAYSVLQATVAAATTTPTAKDGAPGEPPLPGAEPPLAHPGTDKGTEAKDPPAVENYPPPPAPAPTDGSEPAPAPVADGDIPSQFTRVMGKGETSHSLAGNPEAESQVNSSTRDQIQVRWWEQGFVKPTGDWNTTESSRDRVTRPLALGHVWADGG